MWAYTLLAVEVDLLEHIDNETNDLQEDLDDLTETPTRRRTWTQEAVRGVDDDDYNLVVKADETRTMCTRLGISRLWSAPDPSRSRPPPRTSAVGAPTEPSRRFGA